MYNKGCTIKKHVFTISNVLTCIIFFTTRSVMVFLPGKRSMALIILVSTFHLSYMLFCNLVQSIDAAISTHETFSQVSTGSHVLIPRPMNLMPVLANHFGMSTPHPRWLLFFRVVLLLVVFFLVFISSFLFQSLSS